MCILFVYVNDSPAAGTYRLILANNRDEFWDRPTKPAAFWDSNHDCISGLDEVAGGTWLGMSRTGHICSLLNVLQPSPDVTKKSRGDLVRNFIESSVDCDTYLQSIIKNSDIYNYFNLVLLNLLPDNKFEMRFFSNWKDSDCYLQAHPLSSGVHGFCNGKIHYPWRKVSWAKQRFCDIVTEHNAVSDRTDLVKHLLDMLKDSTHHLPDPDLLEQGAKLDEEVRKERSACFVYSPPHRYGTRTHSLILVDSKGQCEFIESTMKTPADPNNIEWSDSIHTFCLNTDSHE